MAFFNTQRMVAQYLHNAYGDHVLRYGNIKATIWQNVGEKGSFFSTSFTRPFKDKSREWRNGTSFGLNDLDALLIVGHEAKEWMAAHVLKR